MSNALHAVFLQELQILFQFLPAVHTQVLTRAHALLGCGIWAAGSSEHRQLAVLADDVIAEHFTVLSVDHFWLLVLSLS
jgi:hypothetical protein